MLYQRPRSFLALHQAYKQGQERLASLDAALGGEGVETDLTEIWSFPSAEEQRARLEAHGFEVADDLPSRGKAVHAAIGRRGVVVDATGPGNGHDGDRPDRGDGDRGADRVRGRVQDQDRGNGHIHVFLEPRQEAARTPVAFLEHLDLRARQRQQHRFED